MCQVRGSCVQDTGLGAQERCAGRRFRGLQQRLDHRCAGHALGLKGPLLKLETPESPLDGVPEGCRADGVHGRGYRAHYRRIATNLREEGSGSTALL